MNKLTNILLGAILLIGVGGFIVGLQPEVQPNITVKPPEVTVNPPEITVNPPDVYPNITIDPNEISLKGYEDIGRVGDGIYATSVTVAIGATGTQVVASSPSISYRRLENLGAGTIFCSLDDGTSTVAMNSGIALYASSSNHNIYEMTLNKNLYYGAIRCIATTSAGTLYITQW